MNIKNVKQKKIINPFYARRELDPDYPYEGPGRVIVGVPYWLYERLSRTGNFGYERDYSTEFLGYRICLKRK